jgi:hypothetical protein
MHSITHSCTLHLSLIASVISISFSLLTKTRTTSQQGTRQIKHIILKCTLSTFEDDKFV